MCSCSLQANPKPRDWTLWEAYATRFLDPNGRIVDYSRSSITTSEGQAYALFFSLVANDEQRFTRILSWTQENLAAGDLSTNLPGWLWGADDNNHFRLLDKNSASDADLWIAWTLLSAGRLWKRQELTELGRSLAALIAQREVITIPGVGTTLLPGPIGFSSSGVFQLNPSYWPLQLFVSLSHELPGGPWKAIASGVPGLTKSSSPAGFVLDWIAFHTDKGFQLSPTPVKNVLASYDAIRTYLWAGMLDDSTEGREQLLGAMGGMENYLRRNTYPASEIAPDGRVIQAESGPGFAASVIPFLLARHQPALAAANLKRVQAEKNSAGLYGRVPAYYDQNLLLFTFGWLERYFQFSSQGELKTRWSGR